MITGPFSQPGYGAKWPRGIAEVSDELHYVRKKIERYWGTHEAEELRKKEATLEKELEALERKP